MPSLHELQGNLRHALLSGESESLESLIASDRIAAAIRLDVYRNNVLSSLRSVLRDTFPAVCRLVDQRFFDYAADHFVRAQPPRQPCLDSYGQDFPDFLAAFPPCQDLVYLADVARLEWLLHSAAIAPELPPLQPTALAHVDATHVSSLVLMLQPSYFYLESRWPVDRIWRANRDDGANVAPIDLDTSGARIEVRRHTGDVEMRFLPSGDFAFRAALSHGTPFVAATQAGLAAESSFDAAAALQHLFADGAVIDFTLTEGSQ